MDTKAPGVAARKKGAVLKRGAATQVMTYPRPTTKKVLVGAARDVNRPLSSFMILSSLAEAARLRGCQMADLVPPEELQQYRTCRVDQKRSAAAKRAWATIRAKRT